MDAVPGERRGCLGPVEEEDVQLDREEDEYEDEGEDEQAQEAGFGGIGGAEEGGEARAVGAEAVCYQDWGG